MTYVNFSSCVDTRKYSESFKDVCTCDTLYFLFFDYDKTELDADDMLSILNELTSCCELHDKKCSRNEIPYFRIEEHVVREKTYPGLTEQHYNYMKMSPDGRPNGVGTTTAKKPVDYLVDFVLEDGTEIQTGTGCYSPGSFYGNCNAYIFVKLETLKECLKIYYESNLKAYKEESKRIYNMQQRCEECLKEID